MAKKRYNFSAGPAVLSPWVLEKAQSTLMAHPGIGLSLMEISHRSAEYEAVEAETRANLRQLLAIPDDYRILFMAGGARQHFGMIPMNFLPDGGHGAYLITGGWGHKAADEARIVGRVDIPWDGGDVDYRRLPRPDEYQVKSDAAYLHFCYNETVHGIEFKEEPKAGSVPLICDASSMLASRPMDIGKYAMIYAGAQKNLGVAGMTLVLIREDFAQRIQRPLPSMLDYGVWSRAKKPINTPPVYAVYMTLLVTRWLLETFGDLEAVWAHNRQKAEVIYGVLDANPSFYRGTAEADSRSMMNITWRLPTAELEARFLDAANQAGLLFLKGHKSTGGHRASLYNAMSLEGAQALADFMVAFAKTYQG